MSKLLTQGEVLLKLADMCGNAATGRSVLVLRDELLAHDAALRARLAKVERELDHAKLLVLQLSRDARSPVQDHLLFSTLTAQLAKVEQERDARIAALEAAFSQVDTIGAHVNAECENGCGTKFRALFQDALAALYEEKEATS